MYDLFPWALCCLPGPHQEIFRYQEVEQGYILQEMSRHKLRAPNAPKDFISCYLAQTTHVGLKWLQRKGKGCTSFPDHGLFSSSLTQSISFQSLLKQQPLRVFPSYRFPDRGWFLQA